MCSLLAGEEQNIGSFKNTKKLLVQSTAFRRTLPAAKYPIELTEYGEYWPISFVSWPFMDFSSKLPGSRSQEYRLNIKFSEGLGLFAHLLEC